MGVASKLFANTLGLASQFFRVARASIPGHLKTLLDECFHHPFLVTGDSHELQNIHSSFKVIFFFYFWALSHAPEWGHKRMLGAISKTKLIHFCFLRGTFQLLLNTKSNEQQTFDESRSFDERISINMLTSTLWPSPGSVKAKP